MPEPQLLPRELQPGLVLRRATSPKDLDAILACHVSAFGQAEASGLRAHLFGRPGQVPENFFFVEDVATGEAASSASFIPETWSYEGIPIKVGEVGVVATRTAAKAWCASNSGNTTVLRRNEAVFSR